MNEDESCLWDKHLIEANKEALAYSKKMEMAEEIGERLIDDEVNFYNYDSLEINFRKCPYLKERNEYLSDKNIAQFTKGRKAFAEDFCRYCQQERKIFTLQGIESELGLIQEELSTGIINVEVSDINFGGQDLNGVIEILKSKR